MNPAAGPRGNSSVPGQDGGLLTGSLDLRSSDPRFSSLFMDAARRPPAGVPPIATLRSVTLSDRPTNTTVGLTEYSIGADRDGHPSQKITFYSSLIDPLSDQAVTAVIAHELAHAWLNEHRSPEDSKAREGEADSLARAWGFGPELDALDSEAETVS